MNIAVERDNPDLLVAREVLATHYDMPDARVRMLGNGLLNRTVSVEVADGDRYVMQRLNRIIEEGDVEYQGITQHLKGEGWPVGELIRNKRGELYSDGPLENGYFKPYRWRLMTHIDSDPVRPDEFTDYTYAGIGRTLARFHDSLSRLDIKPICLFPNFHDTAYYADRMERASEHIPSVQDRILGVNFVSAYRRMPKVDKSTVQPIHGDVQSGNADNFLYRQDLEGPYPITLVDLDTVMMGSFWTDVGDLLRSLAETSIDMDGKAGGKLPMRKLRTVAEGYRQEAFPDADPAEFSTRALAAMQHIAVELGMRFVTDLDPIEPVYFTPPDGVDHDELMRHRAQVQWRIYDLAERQKQGVNSV